MKPNQLAIYSQALLYMKMGLFGEATSELSRLTSIIAPHDPHKYISREYLRFDNANSLENDELLPNNLSKKFYDRECVSGRRRFNKVLNLKEIHLVLEEIFTHQGDLELATDHLILSISFSNDDSQNVELFLLMANLLIRQERYVEALTALDEAKKRYLKLSQLEKITANHSRPYVIECILDNNLGDFSKAMDKAFLLIDIHSEENFLNDFDYLIDQLLEKYNLTTFLDDKDKTLDHFKNQVINNFKRIEFASKYFNPEMFALDLKKYFRSNSDNYFKNTAMSQVIFHLYKTSINYLENYCDLLNCIAFDWAELGINLTKAKKYTNTTTTITTRLINKISTKEETMKGLSKKLINSPNILHFPLKNIIRNFEHHLADYFDTKAWVLFRIGGESNLKKAYTIILNSSLRYNPNSAVSYYHMAKICIRQFEHLWESNRKNYLLIINDKEIANEMTNFLRLAMRYWRQASKLDVNHILYYHLKRVHEQITINKNKWNITFEKKELLD